MTAQRRFAGVSEWPRYSLVAISVWGLAACGGQMPGAEAEIPSAASAAPEQPADESSAGASVDTAWDIEQELEDVTYRQTQGTTLQWELHAAQVIQRRDAPAKLHTVTLLYYNDGDTPTIITADEADFDTTAQDALLQGNVRIVAANGDVLESDELLWNAETQRVSTESNIVLRRGQSHIRGTGMDTSPGLEDARIFNVTGIIQGEELRG